MVKYHRIKVYVARLIELLLYITSLTFFKKKDDKRESKKYPKKRFLIVEPFGLGDLILMTSMIGPIKKSYPGCEIGVICRSQ